jgi:hypothetical protein
VTLMYSLALAKRQVDDDEKCSEAAQQAYKLYVDEFDLQLAEDAYTLETVHHFVQDMALNSFEQVRPTSHAGQSSLCIFALLHT